MTTPLLTTKLYQPQPRTDLVPRPRLIEQLNAGLSRKLTLISAPAGFGKTTLLSEWVHQCGRPISWLSLDEGDNDLIRFLSYFVAALQTIDSRIGRGTAVALQSPDGVNIEILLTHLLNEISKSPINVILILDDYHVIESQPVDNALTFIINNLPRHLHLIMSSRIDPSFPLSRLRASGQMTELRVDDLRFTTADTTVFLNQIMGLALSSQDVDSLEARTEGWIAGLQLAALSMQGIKRRADITDFVARFTGSDRYIQDYLTEEVLRQQPKEIKDFLLKTSILNRLSGSLCDAVTQQPNGHIVLENLESGNLFIVPLDNERRWYRYHHLFAELLAHNLFITYPEQIPGLHQRASAWYEINGFLDEAIFHAQSADSKDRMASIVEDHWQEYIHRGELTKLRGWLDYLNPEYTKMSAPLCMAYCWIHVMTRRFDPLTSYVKDIHAALLPITKNDAVQLPNKLAVIPSLVETIEAIIALHNRQPQGAKFHAQKAISLVPANLDLVSQELLQGAAGYWLAQAHRALGELEKACVVLLEVLELLKSSENYFRMANSLLLISTMYQDLGKTKEAITLCEDTITFIEENHWGGIPPSGLVNVILAGLQIDSGDYQEAVKKKNLAIGRELVLQINSQPISDLVDNVEEKLNNAAPQSQISADPLTPRELEVIKLISEGLSNREISDRLFLSLDTVKGHNRKIYGKLGVKNRTQAVNKAISLKIIPPNKLI